MPKAPAPLAIRLAEPVTYLKSSATGEDFRGRRQIVETDAPPAILRGVLTVRLPKPIRIKRIEIKLEGKSRTEWPEGIGPRRTEISEENVIVSDTLTFFNAATDRTGSFDRRAMSLGPGTRLDNSWDLEEGTDEEEERDDVEDLAEEVDRGRGRFMNRAGPRSISLMHERAPPMHSRMESGDITSAYHLDSPNIDGSPSSLQNGHVNGNGLENGGPPIRALHSDRLTRERGPSPAYALHDPINGRESLPRGRKASVREARPRILLDESDEADITNASLSTIPSSAEGSRYPSLSRESSTLRRSRRAFSGSIGTRLDHVNGNSALDDSDDSGPSPRPSVSGSINHPLPTSSGNTSTRTSEENSARSAGPAQPAIMSYHPFHANMMSASNSHNNSRISLAQASTEQPMVEVTRPGSNRSSIVELAPAPDPAENHVRQREGSTSTLVNQFAHLRHRGSMSSLRRESNPSSLSNSPHGSTAAVNTTAGNLTAEPKTNGNGNQERGRKGSKFSFANAFRSISRAGSTSQTRQSSQPPPAPSANYVDPLSRASHYQTGLLGDGRMHVLAAEDRDMRPFGRGGAGRSPSRTRNMSPAGTRERSESSNRGRGLGMKVLGLGSEDGEADGSSNSSNWKEFRKGVYNYPISFSIPPNAPPTIHADFGSVVYRLTATIHRPGALTPNYVEEIEVVMIATPQEDDTEETENILVERQWEDQMRYLIALSGKAFTVGGQIPMSLRIMPMSKCRIHRLTMSIEEKISFFAMERRIARHEATKSYPLIAFRNPEDKTGPHPLLPILSDKTDALWLSPLAAMAVQARATDESEDDAVSQLLNPFGPWNLETMLHVPDCQSKIKFSTKHEASNMSIGHFLKIIMRVERGDDKILDAKGRRKQFDIIIETPLHLLECRATSQNNSLPSYNLASNINSTAGGQSNCTVHRNPGGPNAVPLTDTAPASHLSTIVSRASVSPNPVGRGINRSVSTNRGRASESVGRASSNGSDATVIEAPDTLLERNMVFDRLVSGQESEVGESPPTYDEALRNRSRSRNPRGRSSSRLRQEIY